MLSFSFFAPLPDLHHPNRVYIDSNWSETLVKMRFQWIVFPISHFLLFHVFKFCFPFICAVFRNAFFFSRWRSFSPLFCLEPCLFWLILLLWFFFLSQRGDSIRGRVRVSEKSLVFWFVKRSSWNIWHRVDLVCLSVFLHFYHKRRLSPCRKKSSGADDDDEGCQTRVGRTRSRAGAGAGLEQGKSGVEQSRAERGQESVRTQELGRN